VVGESTTLNVPTIWLESVVSVEVVSSPSGLPVAAAGTNWPLRPARKAADIIGLYLNLPQHAAVFCVDEKTVIQALERLDRVLPPSPGRAALLEEY